MPRLIDLAQRAKSFNLNLTVDAEEADRLELSLEVIAASFSDASLAGWDGFGLAIQAYQKRAAAVIDYASELAAKLNRRMMVRLVKGAYWDSEIKRAQERGIAGYPVFTRKAMTDLNYVACAEKLLKLRPRLFPQFATHNALTVATVLERAGDEGGFELQRLHGMGEALYAQLTADRPTLACRTYAPVGSHRDLLAYLVRRLLENGANSSFVALAADDAVPVKTLLRRPADIIGKADNARHPNIPLPVDLYRPQRQNSCGLEFGDRAALQAMLAAVNAATAPVTATSVIGGNAGTGIARQLCGPADLATPIGSVMEPTMDGASSCHNDGARRLLTLEPHAGGRPRAPSRSRRLSSGATRRAFHRASTTRGRQDARRRHLGSSRGHGFLPLLRTALAASCLAGAKPCRGRPARAMCWACVAAAFSSRFRRGIFHSRFLPGKSPRP